MRRLVNPNNKGSRRIPYVVCLLVILQVGVWGCRSIEPIADNAPGNYESADISPEKIIRKIPGKNKGLVRITGKGKALISAPGQSDRVTLYFSGNRDSTRITIQNRLGMKGGELLATRDSILIYNKVDKYARQLSFDDAHQTRINNLASVNLVDILNYKIPEEKIHSVWVNSQYYLLVTVDNTRIRLRRKDHLIVEVDPPANSEKPYSRIQYQHYVNKNGFYLPQKITITGSDRKSQVTLLIESLTLNPRNLNLSLDIPDSITIQRL